MSVQSFSAVCNKNTRTLILGTMPGIASLNASEYYAHKRNAFWPILLALLNDTAPSYESAHQIDYQTRLTQLLGGGIGLWDVLAQCERTGSLDSAIKSDSVLVNDFAALFKQFPGIDTVAFNGKAAQKLFKKHAMARLIETDVDTDNFRWVSLPSTSPAMASFNLEQKFKLWRASLNP